MQKFIVLLLLVSACSESKTEEKETQPLSVPLPIYSATPSTSSTSTVEEPPCPAEMTMVSGLYCTKVEQKCIKWLPDPVKKFARCAEFSKSVCVGSKEKMNYCIDTKEFATNFEGLPVTDVSWTKAQSICKDNDKRLCSEEEWIFACEGEDSVPYTTGTKRPTHTCHMDVEHDVVCGHNLCDLRKDIDANPECKSPFGIINMAGNVDEWVAVPNYQHSKIHSLWMRSALKGGHWLPVRNRCRPITKDHDEGFHQVSIGFRCCKGL